MFIRGALNRVNTLYTTKLTQKYLSHQTTKIIKLFHNQKGHLVAKNWRGEKQYNLTIVFRQSHIQTRYKNQSNMALSPTDPNSFSRPDLAVVTHTDLKLNVDFENRILKGYAILHIDKKQPTNDLILDIRDLILHSVINLDDQSKLEFRKGESVDYGTKLSITLPTESVTKGENKYKIKIEYETSPNSTALAWLTPDQTSGRKYPYLFSQCQAAHCRSMIPCQDTPSVKSTYSAEILAPSEFTVLMSALRDGKEESSNSITTHKFHQPIPIPSYLIAIAVGALVSKDIGPRSKVWTEKENIDACAYEFAETETMLKTAEELCGEYVWGIYDLLVLPPSFPFGGMENPCLTFVTPTLLAGDRSLVNVVAHEIAHSWTGNLITNANFEHFWLNEGFTVFLERKIKGRMTDEKNKQFEALHGLQALESTLKSFENTPEYTKLVPVLNGIDPDETYSDIPYEKGHTFLVYLEELLGGPKEFEPFLKSYLDTFKYKSIVTSDFKDYLYKYFSKQTQLLDSVDWDTWLYGIGKPPVIPKYDTTLADACIKLADRWCASTENTLSSFSKEDINGMSSNQITCFLTDLVLRNTVLTVEQITYMQNLYGFDKLCNDEIRCKWLRLCLKCHWEDKIPEALKYVTDVGRIKYIQPIYQDLYKWEKARPQAVKTFMENKSKMMFTACQAIAKELHLNNY